MMKKYEIHTDQGVYAAQVLGSRGDWIVCCPTRVCDHTHMLDFASALQHEYRILMIDPPGNGLNRALNYRAAVSDHAFFALKAMNFLGIEQCHWVGHSAGGVVGVILHLTSPGRIKTLTLASTPLLRQGRLGLATALASRILVRSLFGRRVIVARSLDELGYRNKEERSLVIRHLSQGLDHASPSFINAARPLDGKMVRSMFEQLRARHPPMLVIAGQYDRVVRARDQQTVAQMTQARFEQLPCGHMPFLVEPRACTLAFQHLIQVRSWPDSSRPAMAA
jgi:pimeloyl-ACP methyl ester carboxylesterase